MKMFRHLALVAVLSLSAAGVNAEGSGLILKCSLENGSDRVYVLYPSIFRAKRVDGAEAVYGTALDLDHVYQLDFPQTETQYPHRARIFRYTGKIEVEWGLQSFDMFSSGNVFQEGVCEISEEQKKF
jgi:hypothetical protein